MTKNQKIILALAIAFILLLTCCVAVLVAIFVANPNRPQTSSQNVQTTLPPVPTPAPAATPAPAPAPTPTTLNVQVYFSENPASYNDFTVVSAVDRSSNRTDIGTFTIEQLVAGPTTSEQTGGLFTPIMLTGTSNCSGKDFSLSIDQTAKKATLKFCRSVTSAGVGDDARIQNTIDKTLTQFSTVTSVVILDKGGNCFGDESGLNSCLN